MRTPYKYTDDELKLMAQSFNDVLSTLDEITEEKRREKCVRAVAAMLSDSVRKKRLPKADPNQMSFEDKLVMEETLRGPDFQDEDNSH